MSTRPTRKALRVRRKLRGAGPFLIGLGLLSLVLGPSVKAVADEDEPTDVVVQEAPPVVAEAPVEETPVEPTAPDPDTLTAELHLGTRLTALGVMRLPPNPEIVAAAAGDAPARLLWPVDGGHFG